MVVVCVKVRPGVGVVKDLLLAGVDYWAANALSESCFPVGALITVGQIGDYEPACADLYSEPVINQSGRRIIIESDKIESCFSNGITEIFVYNFIQFRVPVLHRHNS